MEKTPIKSELPPLSYSNLISTPEFTEVENNNKKNTEGVILTEEQDDALSHSFAEINIQGKGNHLNGGHYQEEEVPLLKLKRTYDHRTIEGSPYVQGIQKKLDINPTPAKDHFQQPLSSLTLSTSAQSSPLPPPPPPTPYNEKRKSYSVMVFTSASDEHNTGEHHQENALRTALLSGETGCLRRPGVVGAMEWVNCDHLPLPAIVDLLRVHEYEYLSHLERKCRSTNQIDSKKSEFPYFYADSGKLDTDTPLVEQSFTAAKRFCSAALFAVDNLFSHYQRQTNDVADVAHGKRAFVIGRPPGHHAGPSGCVPPSTFWRRPDMTSSGFCLLNTVAVAAAYARYKGASLNSLSVNTASKRSLKIAIVDIDVHHGNGTEEIVRNLQPRQVFLPLPSSWAPVSKFSYKPWLNEKDPEDILFSSIQLFGGENFYPGSGLEDEKDYQNNIVNITLTPLGPGPWDHAGKEKLTQAKREGFSKQASEEFRTKVSSRLLPKLRDFKPDLLFISAGFDAHYDDFYHFLTEEDIHWVTDELCNIVEETPDSIGVISVLEGGYSLESKTSKVNSTASAVIKGRTRRNAANTAVTEPIDSHLIYCQQPGDGGLVKGVLAHTAALAGRQSWTAQII